MMVMAQIDIIMVRFLSSAKEAGFFQVSIQLSALILFGMSAVMLTAAPYFTRLHRQGDHPRLQILAIRSSQASLAFAVVCASIIWVAGENIVSFIYGEEFSAASTTLAILCLANVIQASTGPSGQLLTMTGHEGSTLKAAIAALLVKISFNTALIPTMGSVGAGISLVAAMTTLNFLYWRAARQTIGIDTFALSMLKGKSV
jgi:O-antigen/teichoic acid export membrane protein